MAKIVNYKLLLFTVAMFVIAFSPNLHGSAFAYLGDNHHTYASGTALTNPDAVCGDHKCAPGEIPQQPPVVPIRGH